MSRTLISMLVSSKILSKTLAKNILMNTGLVNTVSRQTCHEIPPPPPPPPPHVYPSRS